MISFNNDEIYDKTIDFIFNLDKTTNVLDFKKIKILFQQNNLNIPSIEFMNKLEEFYGTNSLTKENIKIKNKELEISESSFKEIFNSIYNDNNKLNLNELIRNIKKIENNLNESDFKDYVINEIFNKSEDLDYQKFENYNLNLFKK